MSRWRATLAWIRARLTRRSREAALDDEIQTHLDLLTADYLRAGLSPHDARAAARREFGGVIQVKEAYRDERHWSIVSHVVKDIRHGVRGLCRNPGFTLAAVLTLALGIAANATIFGFVNVLLLRPLPVKDADRLTVFASQRKDGTTLMTFSPREFDVLRAEALPWSSLVAVAPAAYGLLADGNTDRVQVSFVSENYWDAYGLQPSVGTLFRVIDSTPEITAPVIVLSYDYWQSRFRGDRAVVGKLIALGGIQLTVIGVGPKGFHGDSAFADVKGFVPMHAPGFRADDRAMFVSGILKRGTTLSQATASLGALSNSMARDRHESPDDVRLQAFWERLARPSPRTARAEIASTIFFGLLATLVLVIACVNVTGLIVIRAGRRRAEMALRTALGASRSRLVLHLFIETLLVVTAAGATGLLLGQGMTAGIGRLLPTAFTPFTRQLGFGFDWSAAVFIATIVCVTALVIGVVPALRTARPSLAVLVHNSPTVTDGRTAIRRALMVLQVAGAVMLLIVAGLFARSLAITRDRSFGFDRHGVYDFSLNPSEVGVDGPRVQELQKSVLARVASLPGVESAALTQSVPMTSTGYAESPIYPDVLVADSKNVEDVGYAPVSGSYFETLRIPLRTGRPFFTSDTSSAPHVAVVNEAMANRYWPHGAVGHTFRLSRDAAPVIQVVGVAANIFNYGTMQDEPMPFFYLPIDQHPTSFVTLQLRSARAAASVFRDVDAAIRAAVPAIVPFHVQTMVDAIDEAPDGLLLPRLGSWLAACFGLLGLILAVVGVYGVVAYGASQRTREMALRVALGAGPRDIRREVMKSGITVVLGGLVLGACLAAAFSVLTANLYFGVSPLDPATFVGATLLVGAVALAACDVPARRAMSANPVVALKET